MANVVNQEDAAVDTADLPARYTTKKMEAKMSSDAITVTIISSLLSGIFGVGVTVFVTYKLERHKLKLDLARRILGHRYEITGHGFSCAMNEVLAVFSDNPTVLQKMGKLFEVLQTPGKPDVNSALTDFLKEVCKVSGLSQNTLNDTYLIKTFNPR